MWCSVCVEGELLHLGPGTWRYSVFYVHAVGAVTVSQISSLRSRCRSCREFPRFGLDYIPAVMITRSSTVVPASLAPAAPWTASGPPRHSGHTCLDMRPTGFASIGIPGRDLVPPAQTHARS